jgi:hypothetical protein
MKKILLAFSGNDFSNGAFEFARQLNEIQPIILNGFFLPEIVNPPHELHVDGMKDEEGEKITTENVNRFTQLCIKHNIEFRIHIGSYELCLPQLIKETRFSDLFIASSEIFYRSFENEDLHYYLHKALHQSECPVIVIAEEFDFPENIIFAYDGSPSSVFAIKQFMYLFPEMCNKNALVVYVNEKDDASIPGKTGIEELTKAHFKKVEYLKLSAEPGEYFCNWLANMKKTLLVTGSGKRSELSELIKKSFTKEVIKRHIAPVFIAHH